MDVDDLPSTSNASTRGPEELIQYSLCSIIQAHNDDTKSVVETPNGALVSGGRDGFLKFWTNDNGTWENNTTAQQKDCLAINSMAFGSLHSAGWEYLLFLGRKNGSIALYSPVNPSEPIKILQGHKSNVCALHFDEETGLMMSGSWDHAAVVWPVEPLLREDGSEVAIGFLSGHNCSVWAVATVPSKPTKFLTGSADKSIKLWSSNYEEISVFSGHTDVVRALLVLSEVHFLSTSNDASIILWNLQNGNRLRNFLPQHENFIYTMTRLNFDSENDLVITAGEGDCIDIWKLKADATLAHKQAIKVPVESVWSVAPMRNKDFATATSSGLVLLFTADPGRRAPDDIQEFFYSSQYEELADKEQKTQNAKDSTFDMNRFSAEENGGAGENGGFFKRVVGTEFGDPSYQDPFTGTGRYVPSGAPVAPVNKDKKRPRNHLVPLDAFCKFGLDGVSDKVFLRLREMNLLQHGPLKMTDDEAASTKQILTEVDFEINECQIIALEKGLQWPIESIVPALDIFRIALLHPTINEIFCSIAPVLGNPPKGRATIGQLLGLLNNGDKSPESVRILACRALANAAHHEFGRAMLLTEMATFCGAVPKQLCSSKTALQISSASALANFARILLLKSEAKEAVAELGPREDALRSVISALQKQPNFGGYSPVAVLRLLQAIIMLMWGQSTVIYLALEMDISSVLNRIKDAMADEDVKMLVRDAVEMLQAI